MPPDLNALPADEQEIIKKCIKEAKAKAAARAARREQKLARRAARDAGTPVPGRNTKKGKYAARNAKKKAKKEKRKREQEEGPQRERVCGSISRNSAKSSWRELSRCCVRSCRSSGSPCSTRLGAAAPVPAACDVELLSRRRQAA
jgi:hypothetical protein